ncbi:MAG: hypothetical protein ABEH43_11105, partial [Flavobacteriales bacterium]
EFRTIPTQYRKKDPSLTHLKGSLWVFGGGAIGRFQKEKFKPINIQPLKERIRKKEGKSPLKKWEVTNLFHDKKHYWIGSTYGLSK